jgi:hypothetical protein
VSTQSTSPGVVVGSVAAAATTGALVAMGHRLGSVALPFAAIGATLLHRTVTAGSASLVLVGLVLHVTIAFAWSFVFVFLVRDARWRDVIAASMIAAGELVASWLVTSLSGAGIASILPLGDRLVLALAYAIALVGGMRFALFSLRNARLNGGV